MQRFNRQRRAYLETLAVRGFNHRLWLDGASTQSEEMSGRRLSSIHQATFNGIAQQGIDAGLPSRPAGLECVQHVRVNPHIQSRAFHCRHGPAPAAFDGGGLPVRGHGLGVVGIVGLVLGIKRNGRILGGFAFDALPVRSGWALSGFLASFHTASLLVTHVPQVFHHQNRLQANKYVR